MAYGQGITKQYRAEQKIRAEVYAGRTPRAQLVKAAVENHVANKPETPKGRFGSYSVLPPLHSVKQYRHGVAFQTIDVKLKDVKLSDAEYATFRQVTKLYKNERALAEKFAYSRIFGNKPATELLKPREEKPVLIKKRNFAQIKLEPLVKSQTPVVPQEVLERIATPAPVIQEAIVAAAKEPSPVVTPQAPEIVALPLVTDGATQTDTQAVAYPEDFENDDDSISSESDASIVETVERPAVDTEINVELSPNARLTVISLDANGQPNPITTNYDANTSALIIEHARPLRDVAKDVSALLGDRSQSKSATI